MDWTNARVVLRAIKPKARGKGKLARQEGPLIPENPLYGKLPSNPDFWPRVDVFPSFESESVRLIMVDGYHILCD